MKGQWIVLTALAVVVAVAVIYMAYVSSTIVPVASIQRPAYGIMSQDWPELVQLLSGYAAFLAQSAASKISAGALNAGLYNNLLQGHPADIYFQLADASQYAASALSTTEQSLIPFGTFVSGSYAVDQGGFGGTLGPYPAAVVLNNAYSFSRWWGAGALSAPGAYRVYRFVVTPYSPIQSGYVILYSADVRKPTSVGETYSAPIADILNQARSGGGYNAGLLKQKLYLILVNNTALSQALQYYAGNGCNYHNPNVVQQFNSMLAGAFIQLPWWSEYLKCPFCLFDFKMPRGSLASPGSSDEVMVILYSQPTSSVYLTLDIPLMMQMLGITPPSTGPNFCYDSANYQYAYQTASPALNNNPYAVYNFSGVNGFFNAAAMAGWPSSVVYSTCHSVGPEYTPQPIEQLAPTSVYGNSTVGLLLGAVYPAGTYDVGYQIWNGFTVPSNWPGFQVRVLVNVTQIGAEKMGYLALFWGGYSGSTFPWCADMVAVQPESYPPTFVWSYQPQGYITGPWQTYSWQYGGSYVPLSAGRWYVLSISQILGGNMAGQTYLAAYKFLSNSTGPMAPYVGQWLSMSPLQSFNIVLGTDTEDFPQSSTSSWTDAAIYDFLAVRPWTYPEPSAVLTTLGSAPVVGSPRPVVLAWGGRSYALSKVNLLGNISLALVTDLNITQTLSVNASVKYVVASPYNYTYVRYTYGVLVSANVPKGALGASFNLYTNYGGILYNYTCGSVSVCNQTLAAYYGFLNGVDAALYNATFLSPRHSTSTPVAQILGASLAVNNITAVHPQVYYLWSGSSLYLVNVGNMDAVFYFPWQSGAPIVQSVSPNDGVFGAKLDVAGPGGSSWTLVMVPPASAVNVTFYPSYLQQAQSGFPGSYAPTWELNYIAPISLTSSSCRLLQVYFPSSYSGDHLVLIIPPSILRALGFSSNGLSFYMFSKGSWAGPLTYSTAYWGDVWLRVQQSPGWFAYRGALLELCPGGSPSSMASVADLYVPLTNSPYVFSNPISLSNYPSGFAVVVNMTYAAYTGGSPSNYLYYIYLANTTNPQYQCPEGTLAGKMIEIFNGYSQNIPGWYDWWNQYASVCGDQNVWTTYGTGLEVYFVMALTPQFANYHIITATGGQLNTFNKWWYNGWPNTAYSQALLTTSPPCTNLQQCNGPMWSFQYLVVGYNSYPFVGYLYNSYPFGVDVIPYTWPLPYFILNGQIYQTI
jgi:hypothetical protein